MRNALIAAVTLSAAVLAAGCKDEPKPTTPAAPGSPATAAAAATQNASAAAGNAAAAIGAAASDAKAKAGDAASDAGAKMSDTAAKAGDKASEVKDAVTGAAGVAEQKAGATNGGESEAGTLATKVGQYIKDRKFDDADKAIAQLDKLKPSLGADWGPKIDGLKTALEAAKKVPAGIKIPGT